MKTLKCPICGNDIYISESPKFVGYLNENFPLILEKYYATCVPCGYRLNDCDSQESAVITAENFILNLFTVKIRPGDLILSELWDCPVEVVEGCDERCRIKVKVDGALYSLDHRDIAKWPWELKQEGGQQ